MNISLSRSTHVVFIITVVSLLFIAGIAQAASLNGWAWGGTSSLNGAYQGLGWISSSNTTDGSPSSYSVAVPDADGVVPSPSYMWSEYYGWISFAESSGCPSAHATYGCSAYRQGNMLKGWARVLSATAGGFSGWISLDTKAGLGETASYGLNLNLMNGTRCDPSVDNSKCTYAWSEDFGWIEMSGVTFTMTPTPLTVGVTATPPSGPAPLNANITATLGGTATGPATYQFDCTNDGTMEHVETLDVNTLSYTCNYTTDGVYTPTVTVTRGLSTVPGSDTVTVTASALPDLTASLPSVTNPATVGTDITLTSHVANTGSADAGPYNIRFYIDTNGDGIAEYADIPATTTSNTAPGGSNSESIVWTIPSGETPGTWKVGYFADTDNEVDEGAGDGPFANWSGWQSFTVNAAVTDVLQVCRGTALIARSDSAPNTNRSLTVGSYDVLAVYYDDSFDCAGTNIAQEAGVVTDDPADPNVTVANHNTGGSKRVTGASASGDQTENVTVSKNSKTVTIHYTVIQGTPQ